MRRHYFKIAGVGLATLTAAAHVFIGTFDTLRPVLLTDLHPAVQGTIHACWHFLSLFLGLSVWHFARGSQAAKCLADLWIGFALIFVAVGIYTAGLSGLLLVPQWLFLGAAGLLINIHLTVEPRSA